MDTDWKYLLLTIWKSVVRFDRVKLRRKFIGESFALPADIFFISSLGYATPNIYNWQSIKPYRTFRCSQVFSTLGLRWSFQHAWKSRFIIVSLSVPFLPLSLLPSLSLSLSQADWFFLDSISATTSVLHRIRTIARRGERSLVHRSHLHRLCIA